MSGSAVANAKRVAFQGEPGAYANLAAREAIPHGAAIPQPSFEDAIEAVRSGDCDLCVIRESMILQFRYLLHSFHVGRVASSTEDHGDLGFGIDVRRGD